MVMERKKVPELGESEKGQEFPLHSSLQFSFRIPIVKLKKLFYPVCRM